MAIGLTHEEYRNHSGKGLRELVISLDSLIGNSTWRSTATDAASLQTLIRAQSLLVHPADTGRFQIAIRRVDELVRLGILDSADIAAMNDLATSRGVFEAEDNSLTSMR